MPKKNYYISLGEQYSKNKSFETKTKSSTFICGSNDENITKLNWKI